MNVVAVASEQSQRNVCLLGDPFLGDRFKRFESQQASSDNNKIKINFIEQLAEDESVEKIENDAVDLVWFASDSSEENLTSFIEDEFAKRSIVRLSRAVIILPLHACWSSDEARAAEEQWIQIVLKYAKSVMLIRMAPLLEQQVSNAIDSGWDSFFVASIAATTPTLFVSETVLFNAIVRALASGTTRRIRRYVLVDCLQNWLNLASRHQHDFMQLSRPKRWLRSLVRKLPPRILLPVLNRWASRFKLVQLPVLAPSSLNGLLEWYNAFTYRYIQVAGYNHGVTHFGWRFPEKILLKTSSSGKLIRICGEHLVVDAGLTLRASIDYLRVRNREFYVVPNFSYICMGTLFYVPVHGSGTDVSILGETIDSALIYDPVEDRILKVRRGTEAFEEYAYNRARPSLCLRLKLRVRPSRKYFRRDSTLESPTAEQLLDAFASSSAQNIEIRKSKSTDRFVSVREYFAQETREDVSSLGMLEVPRDRIGRVWDRIEETPGLRELFHWYIRNKAFHTELFLTEDQFIIFWNSHERLPLKKIQLRWIHRDHLPHSPIGAFDRVSVDLFMLKKHRAELLDFLAQNIPNVEHNPGKQSLEPWK